MTTTPTTTRPDSDLPRWRGGFLTVGALRRIMDGMADDTIVVMDDGSGWYSNVGEVCAPPLDGYDPDDGGDWACLTLFTGASFDTRQI
jgi:hypothetical protein